MPEDPRPGTDHPAPPAGPARCVGCGAVAPAEEMFGVVGDLRCADCAQGVRRRMAVRMRPLQRERRPVATVAVLGAAVVLFLLGEIAGRGAAGLGAIQDALLQDESVWRGAWWKHVTTSFLHGGLLHLAMNGLALWQLGRLFELVWGPVLFLVVMLGAGTAGSAVSWIFNAPVPTVGLSGGIFGLCLFIWALRRDHHVAQAVATVRFRNSLLAWMGLSLLLTWSGAWQISNSGHATGAAVGWLLGRAHVRLRGRLDMPLGAAMVLLACLAAHHLTFGSWGFTPATELPRSTWRDAARGDPAAAQRVNEMYLRALEGAEGLRDGQAGRRGSGR